MKPKPGDLFEEMDLRFAALIQRIDGATSALRMARLEEEDDAVPLSVGDDPSTVSHLGDLHAAAIRAAEDDVTPVDRPGLLRLRR